LPGVSASHSEIRCHVCVDFERSIARINVSAERSGIRTPNLPSLETHEEAIARSMHGAPFAQEQPACRLAHAVSAIVAVQHVSMPRCRTATAR